MRRRGSRTPGAVRVGKRLHDILTVLYEKEDPFIQITPDSAFNFRYDIEGFYIHRSALERLVALDILELGKEGVNAERVKFTKRGRELWKNGKILIDWHVKQGHA